MARVALGTGRDRQPLRDRAPAAVARQAELAQGAGVEVVRPGQAELGLRQFLARVEVQRLRRSLLGAELELLTRQTQRVVGRLAPGG